MWESKIVSGKENMIVCVRESVCRIVCGMPCCLVQQSNEGQYLQVRCFFICIWIKRLSPPTCNNL